MYGLTAARLKYAQPVYDALNAVAPVRSSYGVQAKRLDETSRTNGVCVYCECAFHDDVTEAAWIIANTGLLGEMICKGVCVGAGVTYVPPEIAGDGDVYEAAGAKLIAAGWGDVLVAMAGKI